ncbi:MAG: response regulator transcription factor [Lewinellaceae bacterium]|nr:response regulator transcription factor [Saprospiraceae bacterium]MCB0542891.1 response regulator transcription factor [Saprospiraceae bacterium]MCB9305152.1 response regulator transcription factor [Lewinellaceae bacterium]
MEKVKLLYVEDEPFLGKIVRESLESRAFEVCMVGDGAEVITALERFQPDICVLDVMLPNRDGFSLAEEIRRKKPALPIVFVTAKNQTEDVLRGFATGGNDYLRKPFSMEELIARLHNLLALSKGKTQQLDPNEGVQIGKYSFYPLKYELRRDGSTRKLSARETDLLKTLVENRNFTVARKDILLKVWGDDNFFNSRNLDVYITKLRDYLREDPAIEIITIKGVGYHFVAG